MARTLRRKVRNSGDGGKVGFTRETGAVPNVPQIQELQNMMDSQASKVEAIRATYSSQNTQLAKANASLMMKLSDLEKKVSELVKENVSLRSTVSVGEVNYKKRLDEQLEVLENGISHRIEEIFHMFDRVRAKENILPEPSSSRTSELRSILRNRRVSTPSIDGRKSASSIQFIETEDQGSYGGSAGSIYNTEGAENQGDDTLRKKRRKSSRRESIFLPTDFDFADERPGFEPGSIPGPDNVGDNSSEKVVDDVPGGMPDEAPREEVEEVENAALDEVSNEVQSELEVEHEAFQEDNNGNVTHEVSAESNHAEGSFSFTNSIIEYSIPEEAPPPTSTGGEQLSSSKIEVFRDEPDVLPSMQNDGKHETDLQINDATFVPLSTQNKVKHSMRAPGVRGRSKIVDEVMPTTNNGGGTCDIDFTRTRRTRGKAIDYTLPSLRAKMRRPTEKFVDATTFTSIHELQVTNARRNYRKHQRRESANDISLKGKVVIDNLASQNSPTEPFQREGTSTVPETTQKTQLKQSSIKNVEGPVSKNKIRFQDKPILKDITNKPKANKTRKLFKNAIINDICENHSGEHDETSETSGSGGSSFRLNEEDLSVFDLIGSHKIKPSSKTYRTKLKKMVTK